MNSQGFIRESSHVVFAERIIPRHQPNSMIFDADEELLFEEPDHPIVGGNLLDIQQQVQVPLEQLQENVEQLKENVIIVQSDNNENIIKPMTDNELDELLEIEMIPEVRRSNRNILPIQRLNYGHNKINFTKHINSAKSEFAEALIVE